jgi:hypothetical protein
MTYKLVNNASVIDRARTPSEVFVVVSVYSRHATNTQSSVVDYTAVTHVVDIRCHPSSVRPNLMSELHAF